MDYLERLRLCDRSHLQIEMLRKIIEEKTRNFFESLVHQTRLKSSEFLSRINKSHSELQNDVNLINRVVAEANYLSKNNRQAEFLLRYRVLRDNAEF